MLHSLLPADKYNPATLRAYAGDIKQYESYCKGRSIDPLTLTTTQAAAYRDHLTAQPVKPSTTSRKLSAMWALFEAAIMAGKTKTNPFTGVQVKRDRALVKHRRKDMGDDYERLLRHITMSDKSNVRDRVVFRVMHDTKVALREILQLNVRDFDNATSTLTVGAVVKDTAVELWAYIQGRNSPASTEPLFVNKNGGRISDRSIRRRLTLYCRDAGINGLSPYAFSGTQKRKEK